VPGGGTDSVVARLDPESSVKQGKESELWVDTSRIHFFDTSDGRSLTSSTAAPAAGGGNGSSAAPAEAG
jgi:multiple sugar transport system ATP-binding protein